MELDITDCERRSAYQDLSCRCTRISPTAYGQAHRYDACSCKAFKLVLNFGILGIAVQHSQCCSTRRSGVQRGTVQTSSELSRLATTPCRCLHCRFLVEDHHHSFRDLRKVPQKRHCVLVVRNKSHNDEVSILVIWLRYQSRALKKL